MKTSESVDPLAQQRFTDAALRTGEAHLVEGRVVYEVGAIALGNKSQHEQPAKLAQNLITEALNWH